MLRTLAAHLRAQWMGALALFLVLAGGTAYAANTIGSSDIIDESIQSQDLKNGQVHSSDIGNNQVQSVDVKNEALTGADIAANSLGEVPSATLGGLAGESPLGDICDPNGAGFITCAQTGTITLAAPTRVLLIGQIRAVPEMFGSGGFGACHVGTNAGPVFESAAVADVTDNFDSVTTSGITGVVGPGPIAFGLDCDEEGGGIRVLPRPPYLRGALARLGAGQVLAPAGL